MSSQPDSSQSAIDISIRLSVIFLLAYACFQIFSPFLMLVAWGLIIAVALYPALMSLEGILGGRSKLALASVTVIGLGILIVPTVLLATSMVEAFQSVHAAYEAGTLHVPPPPSGVAEWPLIGEQVHQIWAATSSNLTATIERFSSQLATAAGSLLQMAASGGATILQFVLAVLIAAAFMANAEAGHKLAISIGSRLAGDTGPEFVDIATATTRSVAQGVLGVAVIQAILGGIGMLVIGVPAAGVWALLILVLAIVQLPPLIILGPVMVYVFGAHDTVPAVLFAAWGIAVSASDAFLKPMFLGRGMDIPMLVILVGAIGGMMLSGVIGLFVGAITLAVAYQIFTAWLDQPAGEGAEG
ncbi:MAG: AI-2E family transporter [Deltaproteobacteria bacterium]|nr:AI-2E family transporter [Deltaproteobacteria bacterium]MBW2395669.1 AI-2E family transporter [Deltaproteobacteria bacterium]